MIRLINGRGQVGSALKKLLQEAEAESLETSVQDVAIYHTWNFLDKTEQTQRVCYEKFREFVDQNPDIKIVFTSTYSQTNNPYNHYKRLAEKYLLEHHNNGQIVRLPTLIGKGVFEKFRRNEIQAFGEMEIMSVQNAARKILTFAASNPRIRNKTIQGVKVPAKIVQELVLFGRNGEI